MDDLLQILILEDGLCDDGVAELIRSADFDPLLLLADRPKLDYGVQLAPFMSLWIIEIDALNHFVFKRRGNTELVLHTGEILICDKLMNGSFHKESVAMLVQVCVSLTAFYLMLSDIQTITL